MDNKKRIILPLFPLDLFHFTINIFARKDTQNSRVCMSKGNLRGFQLLCR